VFAYPRFIASYAVSVRQYRILPFGFLQCMSHPKPPCHLLMLPGVTPAHKGLTPSGKIHLLKLCLIKFICIFKLFQQLSAGALCSCKAHTMCKFQSGVCACFSRGFPFRRSVLADMNAPRNPLRNLHQTLCLMLGNKLKVSIYKLIIFGL